MHLCKSRHLQDMPKYMLLAIGHAVGVYAAMARYLKGYADGVTQKLPPPAPQ